MDSKIVEKINALNLSNQDLKAVEADVLGGDYDESDIIEPPTEAAKVPSSPTTTESTFTRSTPASKGRSVKESDSMAEDINAEIQKKRNESKQYPSMSTPLMRQPTMSEQLAKTSEGVPDIVDERVAFAEGILDDWSRSSKRGLTRLERNCLISAIISGAVEDPCFFNYILLGYNIRGEHNVNEVRNVATAMQELMNSMVSSHKGIDMSSKRILDGVESAIARGLKSSVTPSSSTIPAVPKITPARPSVPVIPSPSVASIPTGPEINKVIDKKKKAKTDIVKDSIEDFTTFTGRDEKYIGKILKRHDAVSLIDSFILGGYFEKKRGKGAVWSDFLTYAKGQPAQVADV